jgi:hypothetical protein
LETETPILLQDIHEQWLLDRNPLILPSVTLQQVLDNGNPQAGNLIARLNQVLDTPDVQVQEPLVVVKKRSKPVGSKNKTSTTRDKSHFEYVEGRKCGVCGQSGHNLRTCLQK